MKPALLLLPNLLGEHRHHEVFLPQSVDKTVATIDGLIAESEKSGRRFLSRFETKKPTSQIPIALYNEHTPDADIDFFLEPIQQGERWGVISDCGLPCLADPGAKLVSRAYQLGITVQAFVGPSSIFLAIMLSGLPGQSFSFHGYLEKKPEKFRKSLLRLEDESKKHKMTQVFMERPYYNRQALEMILDTLDDETMLCVAWELTTPNQGVLTQPVKFWKKSPLPNLDKKPALFLLSVR
ncbi:MAG: Ribosomal RNA small subunit methyltransferase I [Chlamydiae bacterium]|nr:Ribosomal RNA small subunit methyltransferase I [Chlamydiota bacterium]